MSIKSKIEQLTLQERRQLAHAFDCQVPQFVEFGNSGEFVGVHLNSKRFPNLHIKESAGIWSYGIINKRN